MSPEEATEQYTCIIVGNRNRGRTNMALALVERWKEVNDDVQ